MKNLRTRKDEEYFSHNQRKEKKTANKTSPPKQQKDLYGNNQVIYNQKSNPKMKTNQTPNVKEEERPTTKRCKDENSRTRRSESS